MLKSEYDTVFVTYIEYEHGVKARREHGIGPASVSRYMARLRATGADLGQDTIMIFSRQMTVVVSD